MDHRIEIHLSKGKQFLNFIYINGHVMMYLGKAENPNDLCEVVPLTYQQIWGFKDSNKTIVAVIGKSAVFSC